MDSVTTPTTEIHHTAYTVDGVRIAAVIPHGDRWRVVGVRDVADLSFATVETAKLSVTARNHWRLAEWREEEVQQ